MSATPLDHSKLTTLVGYVASRAAFWCCARISSVRSGPLGLKVLDYSLLVLVASNAEVSQKQLGRALDISAPNSDHHRPPGRARLGQERVRSASRHDDHPPHRGGRELVKRAQKIAATMEEQSLAVLSPAERALLVELLAKVGLRQAERRVQCQTSRRLHHQRQLPALVFHRDVVAVHGAGEPHCG